LPALGALGLAVVLRAVRWGSLFRPARRPPLRALTEALVVSYFFNSLLPARAGEIARVIDLKRRAGTSRAETTATVVVERVYDVVALLLLLFVLFPWMPRITWIHGAVVFAACIAVGVLTTAAMLAVWGERPLLWLMSPLRRVGVSDERVGGLARSVGDGLAAIRDIRLLLAVLLWTVASWTVAAFSAWLLMIGFGLHLSFVAAVLVVITVNLSQIVPSLPAGLGVFEAATVVGLRAYGVADSRALSYALVLHAINFVPYVVAGPLLLRPGRFRQSRPLTGRRSFASHISGD
jgi:uncharacterized protein (TIRG00374 family)